MLLSTKNGIVCDACGMGVIEKFTYYSFDLQEVIVKNSVVPALQNVTIPIFSFDICQHCMENIKATIIKCYRPTRITPGRQCPQGIFCDLTGRHLSGDFTCYNACVSIVAVDTNLTPAAKVMDPKYLELWISDTAFEQLKARAIELRKNKENQTWSSSST